jgi:agmatine/peptidylarginine deiminase
VAFVDNRTILVADYGDESAYKADTEALRETFGDERHLTIIKLPCYDPGSQPASKKSKHTEQFDSAEGAYVNMLVSDKAIYVPQFGSPQDQLALEIVRTNTDKKVLSINTSQLAHMGGSVRCMSWQIYRDTEIATSLLGKASKNH